MKTILLVKDNSLHWALMHPVLERIKKFCKDFESVADPEHLCQQTMNAFVLGNPSVIVLALVDEQGLMGHVLCETSDWAMSRFATILQYRTDRPASLADRREGYAAIEAWAHRVGALGTQVFARNRAVARAFRFYGLEECQILLRKPVVDPLPIAREGDPVARRGERPLTMPRGI